MRRKDREMPESFAYMVADKCEWAVLSMTDPEGSPYCIPVSIARDGTSVYFHCALEGFKTDCLKGDDRVCIACVGDTCLVPRQYTTEYESAILRGRAVPVLDTAEKIHALRLLCQRHAASNMEVFDTAVRNGLDQTAVWRVEVSSATGKRCKVTKQN